MSFRRKIKTGLKLPSPNIVHVALILGTKDREFKSEWVPTVFLSAISQSLLSAVCAAVLLVKLFTR